MRSSPKKVKKIFLISLCFFACLGILKTAKTLAEPLTNAKTTFPNTLPVPNEKNANTPSASKTPEYVVIHASDQATFSSEITTNVANLYVKEGSRFTTGQTLLELDCRLQQAELEKALAQQMAVKQAYDAAKKLKTYGSISDYELIKASSEAKVANAEVAKLSTIVEKCTIKAPFNGSVAELMVHAHESVKQGDALLKIVNLENLQFELLVPSCWLKGLQVGSEFSVSINETGQVISAKITEINPQIEPISQSVRLIATITPPDPKLLPGMSGQAKFPEILTHYCSQGEKIL